MAVGFVVVLEESFCMNRLVQGSTLGVAFVKLLAGVAALELFTLFTTELFLATSITAILVAAE